MYNSKWMLLKVLEIIFLPQILLKFQNGPKSSFQNFKITPNFSSFTDLSQF